MPGSLSLLSLAKGGAAARRESGTEKESPQRGSAGGYTFGFGLAGRRLEAAVVGVVGDLADDFDEGGELHL